jgi:hypothetical protein
VGSTEPPPPNAACHASIAARNRQRDAAAEVRRVPHRLGRPVVFARAAGLVRPELATLPSAVLATTDAPPPAETAVIDAATRPATTGMTTALQDVLVSGKVVVQDISFTAKVNKSSPTL